MMEARPNRGKASPRNENLSRTQAGAIRDEEVG